MVNASIWDSRITLIDDRYSRGDYCVNVCLWKKIDLSESGVFKYLTWVGYLGRILITLVRDVGYQGKVMVRRGSRRNAGSLYLRC